MSKKKHYHSIFVSDIHLGFRGSNVEYLTKILKSVTFDKLYLLGDIIDIWALKETPYWKESHTDFLKLILKKSKKCEIIFIPGNHDFELRKLSGLTFGNVKFEREYLHESLNGHKILCVHGDEYDAVMKHNKVIIHIGSFLYDKLIILSHYLSKLRQLAGRVHWSLSKYIKRKVKAATSYIGDFEGTLIQEATKNNYDGIICGHIHNPSMKVIDGKIYMNCGDWVESLSFIAEDEYGIFHLFEIIDEKLIEINSW